MTKFITTSFILSILIIFSGCKSEKELSTKISRIDSLNKPIDKGMIYSLPKTELVFKISLVKTTTLPGPYHKYGEQLLGISRVPHQVQTYWKIDDLQIEEFTDIDYDHIYVVEPRGRFSLKNKFTKKGWILPLTSDFGRISEGDFIDQKTFPDQVHYKDLSVKKFVGKETKTVYKSVWKDSLYAKVPVQESYTLKKNLEQKAKEAANFIFMIREKRFELISGMGDYYPEGEALKAAIEEMNSIEERYLHLFTGKKFRDTIEYTLHWSPTEEDIIEPHILFRFSANEGIIDSQMQKGNPIWIEFNKISDMKKLENYFQDESLVSDRAKFYYRFPAKSIVRLKQGDETIARKYLEIFQYGTIVSFPVEYMDDKKVIDYYKELKED